MGSRSMHCEMGQSQQVSVTQMKPLLRLWVSEMYLGPDQTNMNERLAKICNGFSGTTTYTYFIQKQLRSGLSRQSCLYFHGFWGSELLNGCLVV